MRLRSSRRRRMRNGRYARRPGSSFQALEVNEWSYRYAPLSQINTPGSVCQVPLLWGSWQYSHRDLARSQTSRSIAAFAGESNRHAPICSNAALRRCSGTGGARRCVCRRHFACPVTGCGRWIFRHPLFVKPRGSASDLEQLSSCCVPEKERYLESPPLFQKKVGVWNPPPGVSSPAGPASMQRSDVIQRSSILGVWVRAATSSQFCARTRRASQAGLRGGRR